jgi:hypothetical protein
MLDSFLNPGHSDPPIEQDQLGLDAFCRRTKRWSWTGEPRQ